MVPSSHYVVPRSHVILFLSHSVVPLFFFSHLMVLSSYCAVPISNVAVLHTSSVQVGNLCAQLFANSICSLLTASCLSFSSDPKKIQNISLFHQTFVYGWISMAIASSHQIPHHNWWCLPLWHSPRLTISLSLSLSSGFLYFLLLSSPAVAELLLPLTPIAIGGASHQRHSH